jgi:hypothetical protein
MGRIARRRHKSQPHPSLMRFFKWSSRSPRRSPQPAIASAKAGGEGGSERSDACRAVALAKAGGTSLSPQGTLAFVLRLVQSRAKPRGLSPRVYVAPAFRLASCFSPFAARAGARPDQVGRPPSRLCFSGCPILALPARVGLSFPAIYEAPAPQSTHNQHFQDFSELLILQDFIRDCAFDTGRCF